MHIPTLFEHVSFTNEGQTLFGKKYGFEPIGDRQWPIVIYFHGYGGNRKSFWELARKLTENGIMALGFDFRGCGKSEGVRWGQTIADAYADAIATYDLVRSWTDVDPERISILGSSLGAYLGALVSAERPVSNLVMSAPAIYPDAAFEQIVRDIPSEELAQFRNEGNLTDTKAVRAIKKFTGNLLVIRHEKDEQMPARIADTYVDSAVLSKERKLVEIPGAVHRHTAETAQRSLVYSCEWLTK